MDEKFWFSRKVIVDHVVQQRDIDTTSLVKEINEFNNQSNVLLACEKSHLFRV